jgi:hypothetical protein
MSEPDDPNAHRLIDLATDAYARKLEVALTAHPATDALIAYQEGRLESSQAEELRSHLVACPLCAEALERLDAYDDDSDPDRWVGASAASSAKQSWDNFRKRSAIAVGQPTAGSAEESTPASVSSSGAWTAWALAASVLFALGGGVSLFLAFQPNGQLRESRATGDNPFVFDLLPDDQDAHRNADGIQIVDVPREMDPIVPRLLLGDQTAYSSYSVILTRISGETLWKQSGLKRQPSGGFALLIPRSAVSPGKYVLRLLGETEGAVRELASYTFRLHYLE